MAREQLINFLRSTELVSHGTALEIADRFHQKAVSKNQFFLNAGQHSNEYFFLADGFMRSFAISVDGEEVTTNFYSSNQVVFEVSSFFNRNPSKENIQALTDCTGLYITYAELNELFHGLQEFREFGRQILVRGFSSLKDRMLSMITETTEERYNKLLLTKPEIFQHAPLKYIASYLGITDTSLSRIRKEFSKKHTA
jgi:CRP-like cAMP-binding protein